VFHPKPDCPETVVLRAGRTPQAPARNNLDEQIIASPGVS
jgi:hypothetical protein